MVRAAVLIAERKFEVQDFPKVESMLPGEAVLRVEACGMCGSDVETYSGGAAARGLLEYPTIPGHETVGRIHEIGDRARELWKLDIGDRVAVVSGPTCGVCDLCRTDLPGWRPCPNGITYGYRATTIGSGLWGGFAEFMHLLPGTTLMRVPERLSPEDCVLFNPLAAGFDWVVRCAGTRPGDTVVVLGAGQRGLACVLAAREAGAAQVIVTGLQRDAQKLALAKRLGASRTVIVEHEDVVEVVRGLTEGQGAERVVDTTPHATRPVLDALSAARWGGTVVLAGFKHGEVEDFPSDQVIMRCLTVKGVLGTSSWSNEQAIKTLASGRYPIGDLHSHRFGLDGVDQAVRTLAGEVSGEDPVHITVLPSDA